MIFSFYFFGSRELRYLYKIPSQLPKITIRSTNKVSLNRYQRSNCKGNMVMDHISEGRPPQSHFAVPFINLRKLRLILFTTLRTPTLSIFFMDSASTTSKKIEEDTLIFFLISIYFSLVLGLS